MMIRLLFIHLLFIMTLFASQVRIAAAANLSYVLPELKAEFLRTHPQAQLSFTIGGSGKLAIQIERGAGYDLFLSANTTYVERLHKEGKTLQKPRVYVQGALVMLSRQKRDFSRGIYLLTHPAITKIAIANPKTAPYGKASLEALQKSGIYDKVRSKIVYAESISQTLLYTLKAADIGVVAKSALYAPALKYLKKGANWVEVPANLYTPIAQGAALLRHAKGNEDAKAFYAFLFSDAAKNIFKRYGYTLP